MGRGTGGGRDYFRYFGQRNYHTGDIIHIIQELLYCPGDGRVEEHNEIEDLKSNKEAGWILKDQSC